MMFGTFNVTAMDNIQNMVSFNILCFSANSHIIVVLAFRNALSNNISGGRINAYMVVGVEFDDDATVYSWWKTC